MAYTPNLIGKFPQGSLVAGNEIEAGLPNITGYFHGVNGGIYHSGNSMPDNTGAIFLIGECRGFMDLGTNDYFDNGTYKLDASISSAIYGRSSTVQPPAATVLYYIRAK